MNRECEFMLYLCRCYLFDTKARISDDMDQKQLLRLSKAHNLLGICHCALANAENPESLFPEIKHSLQESFFDLIYLYEMQSNILSEAENILEACETPYIVFKGAMLRNDYPVPEARAMGDIDLLIHTEDRDKVKKALTSHGFKCTKENGPVYNYEKSGVLIEVHTRLIGEYNEKAFAEPFEYAVFDGLRGSFDDNFHLAYLIAHTAHHFKFYGAGAKLVLDLAVMLKERNIDLNIALKYLDEVGLGKFGRLMLTICNKWFGIGKAFNDDTARAEEYLLRFGAFGAERENAADIIIRKELEEGKKISGFRSKLRLAFPSYSKLREIDYIKFIDGRPYLTPWAWCYRFFYNMKNKRTFVAKAVGALDDEKTKAKAADELKFFEEIGLV